MPFIATDVSPRDRAPVAGSGLRVHRNSGIAVFVVTPLPPRYAPARGRGLTQRGEIFDLVETNEIADAYAGDEPAELAGACFSPDGDVLFFNIQGSTSSTSQRFGATYAIWGPWEEGAL